MDLLLEVLILVVDQMELGFSGYVHYTAPSYSFLWSTGATTQNVSGLGMGPVSVDITDCNGCVGTWTGFIAASVDWDVLMQMHLTMTQLLTQMMVHVYILDVLIH